MRQNEYLWNKGLKQKHENGTTGCYDRNPVNPFPNKPWFLHVYSTCCSKTV